MSRTRLDWGRWRSLVYSCLMMPAPASCQSHSHGLSSSCSFITPARFGIQPRSAGCMGQSCSTTQTGRKWRARQAPQWDDLYSPQSLKLQHNNRWTNEAKGRRGGLVLDINSWRSAGRYSVFLQGGRFTPGVCSCIASKWFVCTEHLLHHFLRLHCFETNAAGWYF